MVHGRKMTGLSLVVGAAAVAGFAMSPTTAQAQDVPPVNTGAISLELGADVVTEYWFRGISQQNQGFIFQPYAEIQAELGEVGDWEPVLYAGTWNSFHDRGDKWFESDFYVGVAAEVIDNLTLDVSYIMYRAPADDATAVAEIAVGVSFNDSELMEEHDLPSLNPHVLLAFETQGGADNGVNRGTYLEVGIQPEMEYNEDGDFPVTVSVPVTAGFSLDKYYENADGRDNTFGFIDVGFRAGVPLRFIPREYGDWSASAGVHLLWLGSSARQISDERGTGSSKFNSYGTVGISMSY